MQAREPGVDHDRFERLAVFENILIKLRDRRIAQIDRLDRGPLEGVLVDHRQRAAALGQRHDQGRHKVTLGKCQVAELRQRRAAGQVDRAERNAGVEGLIVDHFQIRAGGKIKVLQLAAFAEGAPTDPLERAADLDGLQSAVKLKDLRIDLFADVREPADAGDPFVQNDLRDLFPRLQRIRCQNIIVDRASCVAERGVHDAENQRVLIGLCFVQLPPYVAAVLGAFADQSAVIRRAAVLGRFVAALLAVAALGVFIVIVFAVGVVGVVGVVVVVGISIIAVAVGAVAIGAIAVGAVAIGAIAVGAVPVAAVAVGAVPVAAVAVGAVPVIAVAVIAVAVGAVPVIAVAVAAVPVITVAVGAVAVGAVSVGAVSVAAVAVGAVAVGAVVVAAFAVGVVVVVGVVIVVAVGDVEILVLLVFQVLFGLLVLSGALVLLREGIAAEPCHHHYDKQQGQQSLDP